MGMNNRQRRAAKAKRRAGRARSVPHSGHRDDFTQAADDCTDAPGTERAAACLALRTLVQRRSAGVAAFTDRQSFSAFGVVFQQQAVDAYLIWVVGHVIGAGWNPLDLREICRRRASEALVSYLLGAVVELTARHSQVDAAWTAPLHGIRPGVDCAAWAAHHRLAWPAASEDLVELLVMLTTLPRIEEVVPRPGSSPTTRASHHVDEHVLRKVRALLAKAESTEFDDEAEALTAKAQQLMTTHSIERALAESVELRHETPGVRRLWLDAPYVEAKAGLVSEIAANNRVRCVFTAYGFVTLIGFAADLDTVEVLTTSLLVQVARAMRATGPQVSRYGISRTRSFRKSFLVAFAVRIGERLRQAALEAESDADAASGGALVPVLADRADAVHQAAQALFPRLDERPLTTSNAAGWVAGRVAADLASLEIRDSIEDAG